MGKVIQTKEKKHYLKKIGWMALIWLLSVLSLAAVAILFRVLMNWAGLTV